MVRWFRVTSENIWKTSSLSPSLLTRRKLLAGSALNADDALRACARLTLKRFFRLLFPFVLRAVRGFACWDYVLRARGFLGSVSSRTVAHTPGFQNIFQPETATQRNKNPLDFQFRQDRFFVAPACMHKARVTPINPREREIWHHLLYRRIDHRKVPVDPKSPCVSSLISTVFGFSFYERRLPIVS